MVKVYVKIFNAFGYVPKLDPGCRDITKQDGKYLS